MEEIKRSSKEETQNIIREMDKLGIPHNIKGFQYIREAITLVLSDPEVINSVTKVLYPSVAKKFNSTGSKVERGIRHAIESADRRSHGFDIFPHGKPTNSEFIAMMADKIRYDL